MRHTRSILATLPALLVSGILWAAIEGAAGGVRWTVPARWQSAGAKPMRVATYTIPGAPGSENGECGVFFFGTGQGGGVEENLQRWVGQFEGASTPKKSEKTISGMKAHLISVSGTYLSPSGPMMQSQGKKPGWSLSGVIIEAPDGNVFFKCVGPTATIQKAQPEIDELLKSVVKAGAAKA